MGAVHSTQGTSTAGLWTVFPMHAPGQPSAMCCVSVNRDLGDPFIIIGPYKAWRVWCWGLTAPLHWLWRQLTLGQPDFLHDKNMPPSFELVVVHPLSSGGMHMPPEDSMHCCTSTSWYFLWLLGVMVGMCCGLCSCIALVTSERFLGVAFRAVRALLLPVQTGSHSGMLW